MRRHSAYGSTLDPLSRSGSATATFTAGGMLASALTDAGRSLSSNGSARGTFTVPTLSADVYTPGGGTGAGYDTRSTIPTLSVTGSTFDAFDTQTQTALPDYMRAQPDTRTLPTAQETRRSTPLRATLPAGVRGAATPPSGRGLFSFGPTRATIPGGRRTLPWISITSAPVDMPTLDTGLFSETPSGDTTTDTTTTTDTYTMPPLDTRGGIGGYVKDGAFYVVPSMPVGAPAVRKGAQERKPAAAPAPAPEAGFPWGWLLLAAGVGGAYWFTRKKGSAS